MPTAHTAPYVQNMASAHSIPITSETATVPTHMLFQTLPLVFGSLRGELHSSVSKSTGGERWDRLCWRLVVLGYSPCCPVWHRLLPFSQGLHLQVHTEAQWTEKQDEMCQSQTRPHGNTSKVHAMLNRSSILCRHSLFTEHCDSMVKSVAGLLVHKMVCYMSSQQTTIMWRHDTIWNPLKSFCSIP